MSKVTDNKTEYTGEIPNAPFRFLWYITKPHKWWALSAILIVTLNASASVLLIYLLKFVITAAEAGNIAEATYYGLLYPVLIFVYHNIWRVSGWCGRNWVVAIRKDTADQLAGYTFRHSNQYYADRFAGSLLSKIGNVVNAVERFAVDLLWHHIEGMVGIFAALVVILTVDVQTGLIFLALLLVVLVTNYYLVPRKRRFSLESADSNTALRGRIVDVFTNISATRQYSRYQAESKSLEEYTNDSRDKHARSWIYSEYMMVVNSLILFAFSYGMFYSLSQQWMSGAISTGEFVVVMVLMFDLAHTLIVIGRTFNDTAAAYGEAEEGLSELLIPHEIIDVPNAHKLKAVGGRIDWQDVTFYYADNKVFNSFNLLIPAGQRVGLVGASGAGKTTFVSLLLRQHDIDSGAIMIDGQNIAEVTQDSLRENIAVVPQEPLLFHRTIKENIAYGKPNATQKEIEAVAKKAQAHKFIMDLSDGYNTLVGERGIKLSGGQKQRVAIARAMLKDAPVLVLDEATSALDSESEVAIQGALSKLMKGKTVVAVAHRLSTLREMDRIIVLHKGKIIEDGNHDELVSLGGTYANLWAHQAGGFLQD